MSHPSALYPAKYRDLIDEEMWAFIHQTNRWYPPETATFSIQQQREIYYRMCREFFAGYPGGIEVEDGAIHLTDPQRAVATRNYRPKGVGIMPGDKRPDAWVIYLHGGGFVVGGLESHDDVCAELCLATGCPVTSVDYRLAPEHTFPADFEDAVGAFNALSDVGVPLIVVGDSAGGNLAAAVSHFMREQPKQPVGQVLIYPGLAGRLDWGTFITHAEAPMLTTTDTQFYKQTRIGGDERLLTDPRCVPLEDDDFSGLPPTVVFCAQSDPLCGDGEVYATKIKDAGGRAAAMVEHGMVHGYLRARHSASRAKASFQRICEAVSALGAGHWPYK